MYTQQLQVLELVGSWTGSMQAIDRAIYADGWMLLEIQVTSGKKDEQIIFKLFDFSELTCKFSLISKCFSYFEISFHKLL